MKPLQKHLTWSVYMLKLTDADDWIGKYNYNSNVQKLSIESQSKEKCLKHIKYFKFALENYQ